MGFYQIRDLAQAINIDPEIIINKYKKSFLKSHADLETWLTKEEYFLLIRFFSRRMLVGVASMNDLTDRERDMVHDLKTNAPIKQDNFIRKWGFQDVQALDRFLTKITFFVDVYQDFGEVGIL